PGGRPEMGAADGLVEVQLDPLRLDADVMADGDRVDRAVARLRADGVVVDRGDLAGDRLELDLGPGYGRGDRRPGPGLGGGRDQAAREALAQDPLVDRELGDAP